jgi:hypothetical protein
VATTDATVPDTAMTATIHQHLARRGLLLAEHYLDAGYSSAALIADFAKIPDKLPHRGGDSWPSSARCAWFVRPGFQIHVICRWGWCLKPVCL